jgi:hypothetical protein
LFQAKVLIEQVGEFKLTIGFATVDKNTSNPRMRNNCPRGKRLPICKTLG